jgi:hypothetical protein
MILLNPEYWMILGGVLWKITYGLVLPCLGLFLFGCVAVWVLKKTGIIDL